MEILNILSVAWKNPIVIITTILVTAYALSFFFVSVFRKYLHRINLIPEDFSLRKHFNTSIWLLLSLASLKIALPAVELAEKHFYISDKIIQIAIIAVVTYFLVKIVSFGKILVFKHYEINVQDEFKYRKLRTQFDFLERLAVVAICLIGFSVILMNFEGAKKIGSSLIASAGLAGIMIGFAAQKTLANLVAGFQIAFTQPFKIGDTVVVDGEWGHIKEITLTYIVVRSWDKRNLVVPITYLLEKPFQNWTRKNEEIIGTVFIYADYSLPIDALREEFMRLLKASELWDGEKASLTVTDATEKSIQIRAIISSKTVDDSFALRLYIRENLIKFIQQHYPDCFPKDRVENKFIYGKPENAI